MQMSNGNPQLPSKRDSGNLVLMAVKIVDDLKVVGIGINVQQFIDKFQVKFKLGTIQKEPSILRFFGVHISQSEDMSITNDESDKLEAISEPQISLFRYKQPDYIINNIEKSTFPSINCSFGWIWTSSSPFCSYYSSYLQQKAPDITVSNIKEQLNILRRLKKIGTTIRYPRPIETINQEVTVLVFTDASRIYDEAQLGAVLGLLFGGIEKDNIYHIVSWLSHKSKILVKSVPSAEILAAAEGTDEGKMVKQAHSELFNIDVKLQLYVDSKNMIYLCLHKDSQLIGPSGVM